MKFKHALIDFHYLLWPIDLTFSPRRTGSCRIYIIVICSRPNVYIGCTNINWIIFNNFLTVLHMLGLIYLEIDTTWYEGVN